MTLDACAETLRDSDPDRFGAVLAAAPDDRPKLVTLYALNLELARAPFQSVEPMLAEMRLQWWADRLAAMGQGDAPPPHDLLTPLWAAWGTDAGSLLPLAEARRRDCWREPFADADAVRAYVRATAGGLMAAAARATGAPDTALPVITDQAQGAGLAAWLRALPALQPMGLGLPLPDAGAARDLAAQGLAAFARARQGRATIPRRSAPALFAGTGARRFLIALTQGADPFALMPEPAPFARRWALARLALAGRWWA